MYGNRNDMTLYPNPVRDELNIEFDNPVINGTLQIFNCQGEIIYKKEISNITLELRVDLSKEARKLNSGIYFVRFEDETQRIIRKFSVMD